MLKRFRVQGFKTLHGVDVELAPLSVLFGPNATGKSNFLEALLLYSRLATSQTLAAAFEPPFRGYPVEAFTLPQGGLKELFGTVERAYLDLEGDFDFWSRTPMATSLRYRVKILIVPKTGALEVVDELLVDLDRAGVPSKVPHVVRGIDQEGGAALVVRQKGRRGRRYENLGLHHTQLSNRQYSGDVYIRFDLLREELSSWHTYYLDPSLAMREPQPPREVTDIGPRGE